jgi:hypothetical protein
MAIFAGLNTARFARVLEGRPVLVSYADVVRRPGVWEREILPRLRRRAYSFAVLDSGAFTELSTPGFRVDLEAFAAFALEHSDLFDVVVNLDDIRGDVERTRANQSELEAWGLSVLPVFHQGEPWEVLEIYVERYSYVGVGLQRPIRGAVPFLREFFARVGGRARVHGFGLTRYAIEHGFPFATTDSTTWVAEYRALRGATPDVEVDGDHGVGGRAARMLALYGDDEVLELSLRSYADLRGFEVEGLEDLGQKGQARTVLARLGWERLCAVLFAYDPARFLVARRRLIGLPDAVPDTRPAFLREGDEKAA